MNRPVRIQYPGALYHVTARGNHRASIFQDERDHLIWLDLLAEAAEKFSLRVHSYCLMPNHYHLLVETAAPNLAQSMHFLNSRYAHSYNFRHAQNGHLTQGRYHAVLLQEASHLLELVRYIVLNPARAGLVSDAADWRWSSYRALLGLEITPAWLDTTATLQQFPDLDAYRLYVAQGAGLPNPLSAPLRKAPSEHHATLADYESQAGSRAEAIALAHRSQAFTWQEIAGHFAITVRTAARLAQQYELDPDQTMSHPGA
ncbi:REP-associated tyrosine transposase [Pseudoduganella violacea]|uniref:REP element-mobilizing transposase RayT n=1 Tax=Pseudoduganella violacea TaxID=1715466 RepID=A0A7W5B9V1_9BURK|nr:transposase [Pseudoduganella violacea]MBB3119191.1 REP element-mobilizing transposase RayT [Pseudoduganella violacea]